MLVLTPSERRGAWIVALLLLIGACYDLLRARAAPEPRNLRTPAFAAPSDSAIPAAVSSDPTEARSGTRLDLNRATASDLDALPGIGPVLAARIVEHRDRHGPFQRTDDLLAVPGIGPALFAKLEPRVTVAAPAR